MIGSAPSVPRHQRLWLVFEVLCFAGLFGFLGWQLLGAFGGTP